MKKKDIRDESFRKEIGNRFKEFRQAMKKSQTELANELKVCQGTIACIERGKIFPAIPFQIYLNGQYNLGIDWLITGSGKMIFSPQYVELKRFMQIPAIERIIFAKLEEIKRKFQKDDETRKNM